MARLTKGWFVEGELLTPPPGGPSKVRSRIFHVLAAANDYRDALKGAGTCKPESCVVRTRFGNDKIESENF